jgi:ABC-2 type transport system permease protein
MYRAGMILSTLATTMPLVMLALWSAAAESGPIRGYSRARFTVYFLSTYVIRQLSGSWIVYQIASEIRNGKLSLRLLRPIHPVSAFAAESLAALPLRIAISIPIVVIAVSAGGTRSFTNSPAAWALFGASMLGAWLLTFSMNVIVGSLSFYIESSSRIMELIMITFFVLSGYFVPIELLPSSFQLAADWLPFKYQLALPVELATGAHGIDVGVRLLCKQWIWVTLEVLAVIGLWRSGVRRFVAHGG